MAVPAAVRAAARAQGALGLAEPAGPVRSSRLGPALGLAGSVPGSIGVRMAFEPGHGRTAVPVRSALVGTTVAVAAVVAAMVFGSSFLGLVGTPHRYGQNWAQELDLRRDLAVLRTLGLLRSQLLRVVSWQASALAAAALLVGVPLGLLAGRWAWQVFAASAGVGAGADVPVVLVLLAIPVTLILANLIAAGPGWAAARVRPALILRGE